MFISQNPIDPNLPASLDPNDLTDWPGLLTAMLADVFTPTSPPLLGLGNNLWMGLASIVVAWAGLRIAFAGAAFRPWDLVTLIIGLSIPLGMLRFYATDIPGVGFSFPMLIPAGANWISELFLTDIIAQMNQANQDLFESWRQNLADQRGLDGEWSMLELLTGIATLVRGGLSFFSTLFFGMLFTFGFLLIFAISLAQILWAQIAISILVFLGPAFIPWMVWKPMSFLFWGWFRAMLTYSLYGVIAAAVMRVWAAVALTLINSVNADWFAVGQPFDGGVTPGVYFVAIVPLFVAAFLSAMKIPELAGALVGGPSGGGFGGMVATAMTLGKGTRG